MGSALPALVGGLVAAGAALGVRWFARPEASALQANLFKYAPWVGLGAGLASAFALHQMGGKAAGFASAAGAAGGAGAIFGYDLLSQHLATQMATTSGLGAIVPEYGNGVRGLGKGTGAIVFEPSAQRGYGMSGYGETVNLGNINPKAFGTPGFNVS